jgi:spoIIIJ-associated protein
MGTLEMRAKTVEEATLRALAQLGLSRDEVTVVVVKEGRGGILGLGAEDAVIRVTPVNVTPVNVTPVNPPPMSPAPLTAPSGGEAERIARETLSELLGLLGVLGKVESEPAPVVADEGEGGVTPVALNVAGEDLGILIGRRGQTLAALQYVVRLVVSRRVDRWVPIVIDVEGYKERRARALETFALEMADRVVSRGTPFTMEPMPPYERRIIHMVLANHARVATESVGQGEERKVVIRPKN